MKSDEQRILFYLTSDKGFNTASHGILMTCLWKYGLDGDHR